MLLQVIVQIKHVADPAAISYQVILFNFQVFHRMRFPF
jgi:hypothetical protein